jgi:hypothetical protein
MNEKTKKFIDLMNRNYRTAPTFCNSVTKARIGIVFKFIIEYSSLRDFGPLGDNKSIFV